MFCDKSPDLVHPDVETTKRLLAEEEGHLWTGDDDDACINTASAFLQFIALSICFLVGTLLGFFWRGDLDGLCGGHVSQYSPLLNEVGITYTLEEFDGSLLKENVFRQNASPEVDAAWHSLGVNYRGIRILADDAAEADITKDQVKIQDKYGGGYVANVEGLHHLQCLNLLRQSLYYNYDYYHTKREGVFANNDYIARRHVSHCLDILRQQLMCTADTGVLGQIWVYPDNPEPYADFNSRHRCKNFDEIRQWAEDNQLPENLPEDFLQRPGPGDRIYKEVP
ncbi:hypothetical protein N7532_005959 [Penicillium argentinense]|uniref:Tat pathway signal sequence n=1 Tax=Penicillium argentinense TaxID=1131581 RepID=A0A9W9FEW4_9EURO|nr:uncharacterized protein N7532_005959 [Penicillium argentinense]KAJ5098958.1 hypothetical protein N7532_005959 [Penicillium argentinense]